MASDLSRNDAREEENLLIEAVALLVQRQRETESLIADQVWQAEERSAAIDRRYAELEARLASIEEQLNRLEPGRLDAGDERLARLREQVEGLKSGGDGRPVRSVVPTSLPAVEPPPPAAPPPPQAVSQRRNVGLLEAAGSTPQERFGLVLIGLGSVAVLFAILTQLRF